MDLLTPGIGLLIWQLFVMITVVLFVLSWIVILTTNRIAQSKKITWLLSTLLLPLVGPILFFVLLTKSKRTYSDL